MMAAAAVAPRSSTHPDVVAYRKKLESLAALGPSVQAVSDEADAVLIEVKTPVPPPTAEPAEEIVMCDSEVVVEFKEEEPTTQRRFPIRPPRP